MQTTCECGGSEFRKAKDLFVDPDRIRRGESPFVLAFPLTPPAFKRLETFARRRGMSVWEAADHLVEKSLDLFAI